MNRKAFLWIAVVAVVILVAVAIILIASKHRNAAVAPSTPPEIQDPLGYPSEPNPRLTPGDVDPSATVEKICTPGYTSGRRDDGTKVRNVSAATKREVFEEYGVDRHSDRYEVDHLVSLELGGANSVRNLWPQSYTTSPLNASIKDALENRLHTMVCSGEISLPEAQKEIASDWASAYLRYVR